MNISLILQIISPILTIVGMFVTFFVTKYSCKKDIEKLKKEKIIAKTENLPADLLDLMYEIQKNPNMSKQKIADKFTKIIHSILAYASNDAVKIAAFIQENTYKDGFKGWELLSAYSILISQLKYDLTGEIISPDFYFKIKITDYEEIKTAVNTDINNIIKKLNLNTKFSINSN